MALYFVQHGEAVAKTINPDRPLSQQGIENVQRIATSLGKNGLIINTIYHSGKSRAMQSAQIFAKHTGTGTVTATSGMAPNDDVAAFAVMSDLHQLDNTMFVGHLPFMEKLVSLLTTGNEQADIVNFENGGVVCLERSQNSFHMAWFIKPSNCP